MGRWGYGKSVAIAHQPEDADSADHLFITGLFQGDLDLDLAGDLNLSFGEDGDEIDFYGMVGPAESRDSQEQLIASVRQKVDTDGLGDRFIDMYRKKEQQKEPFGDYYAILAGAMMLRCGARIKDDDRQYLRDLVPRISCVEGYASPIADIGFRGPGKRQFLAALDHYQPGVPRSFYEPSCFACGKIASDINKGLDKCARCRGACYCNKVCRHTPTRTDCC